MCGATQSLFAIDGSECCMLSKTVNLVSGKQVILYISDFVECKVKRELSRIG